MRRGKTIPGASGLTLVEVLMSMLVTGIGVLGVVALLPLAFVRSIQATNLTNATILRYNAESLIDFNPRLLLRWQAQQAYVVGDIVLDPNSPNFGYLCTTAGTSGLVKPTFNPVVNGTANDGPTLVWTTKQNPPSNPPPRFVIDPLGWNTLGAPLQTNLGNNGGGAIDPAAILRFNGEVTSVLTAAQQVNLPDSWVEKARGPVTAFTATSATLNGPDVSDVAIPPAGISRVVLTDSTGKVSQTRLITTVANPTVNWSANDPLTGTFTPIAARVETQELRYTWLLTVTPSSGGGTSNVVVTTFFHRPVGVDDELVYQETVANADGVQQPFHFNYGTKKPFAKKGGFLFDCYFGRWYRIVNITNDTGTQFDVFVDQPRPQADLALSPTFGAVFMRGVVDVYPLPLK